MKTIFHSNTLFYYDGAQVFEARDAIGGHYIAVLIEADDTVDRYLVVGVAPESLRVFRGGAIDLRSLIEEGAVYGWYLASAVSGLDRPFELVEQIGEISNSNFLPEPGFVLHDGPTTDEALKEARERNNLVLEVAVEPPEAAAEHRIRVSTLVGLLDHIQTMVKHAYGAAVKELSATARKNIDRSEAYLMDVVVPAAPGSFRVFLEAARTSDLLGQNELERALERVDDLFNSSGDPQAALEKVKQHRGHLAGTYLKLLRFLETRQTGMRYSWATPSCSVSKKASITRAALSPLVEALSGISNIGSEEIEFTGVLDKVDVSKGTWRLKCQEGTVAGRIRENGPSLERMTTGETYRFLCVEEIDQVEGTGREQKTLYLIERSIATP